MHGHILVQNRRQFLSLNNGEDFGSTHVYGLRRAVSCLDSNQMKAAFDKTGLCAATDHIHVFWPWWGGDRQTLDAWESTAASCLRAVKNGGALRSWVNTQACPVLRGGGGLETHLLCLWSNLLQPSTPLTSAAHSVPDYKTTATILNTRSSFPCCPPLCWCWLTTGATFFLSDFKLKIDFSFLPTTRSYLSIFSGPESTVVSQILPYTLNLNYRHGIFLY